MLKNLFAKKESKGIILGLNKITKRPVFQSYSQRSLNTMIIGSVGSGRNAKLILPIINQDLKNLWTLINLDDRLTKPEDDNHEFINGLSIIDSSGDICDNTLELLQANNIGNRAITHIDPLNPESRGINIMHGPADRVVDILSRLVIEELHPNENSNFFFVEKQRNHLRHYIYLLKLNNVDDNVSFDMLVDMYKNPQTVHQMYKQLKDTIPKDLEHLEDEDRKHWQLVQSIVLWFESILLPKARRIGENSYPQTDINGKSIYEDIQKEYVLGLHLKLNDLAANPIFRRVLMGTDTFDFDDHMKNGGILLVDTAKKEIGNLSSFIGKFFLMTLYKARINMIPNEIRFFHHILVDDSPTYLNKSFLELSMYSRPYRIVITTLIQSLSELPEREDNYKSRLLSTIQNILICGTLSSYDAKYLTATIQLDLDLQYQDEMLLIDSSKFRVDKLTPKYFSEDDIEEVAMKDDGVSYEKN